jgi:hypothetical protein
MYMSNIHTHASLEEEKDENMERALKTLIAQRRYTFDQVHEAYQHLRGITEHTGKDPAVEAIHTQMKNMVNRGFSMDRLSKIVGSRQIFVGAVPQYRQFIDELKISDEEKKILWSVVNDLKSGIIECRIDNRAVDIFRVGNGTDSKEQLAKEVIDGISCTIKAIGSDKKYEFWFEEK